MKLIMIKYGELTTKKDNINFFLSTLRDNLRLALAGFDYELTYDKNRMFIKAKEEEAIIKVLTNTFGIHEITIAHELTSNDIEEIGKLLTYLLKNYAFKSFKVVTKRANKDYPLTSMEVSAKLGGMVLKAFKDKKVDIHTPELEINVEIRNNKGYLYFEKIKGLGGYPVGTLGKGLLMLSGGIDSPVAGYMAIKRGIRIEAIYFESPPHTSEDAKNKVLALARILAKYNAYLKVHIIKFTEIQEAIYQNCPKEYLITIMRRMMYRIAENIARKNNAKVIINGESVGQVASQTLTSIGVINAVVKIPVLRPVCCFDKIEIINLAKQIGTYETSILPYEDCCTIFVPEHPVINPKPKLTEEYEALIPYADLIKVAIETRETIKVNTQINEFDNIL